MSPPIVTLPIVNLPAVQLEGITKTFPGVNALSDVSFDVLPGEVHALMGENGAGKSTLMKVLSGVYLPDGGAIRLSGVEQRFRSPRDAQDAGIRMIYQELTVLPNLDIGRNILLGREPQRAGVIDRKALYAQAREILQSLNLQLDPRTPLERLSIGQRQMVEIARAVAAKPSVIVMDEPTSSLGRSEDEALFALIATLKARGVAIVYISHRMEEVFALADRITVLKDGQFVGTRMVSDVNEAVLIEMMIGRKLEKPVRHSVKRSANRVLEVRRLSGGPRVKDVSFVLHRGEVLGLAGLVGAGRTETARMIFGADRRSRGEILLEGKRVSFSTPGEAIQHGVMYVPEDRKTLGLIVMHSVRQNMALPSLPRLSKLGIIDERAVSVLTDEYIARLNVRTPSSRQITELLSGGNQQKVVLAKWLAMRPRVLILDEPTRGIDVNAKAEVFALVREVAALGVSVLLISSETPEVLRESDRIVVFHEGRVAGELEAASATEAAVVSLAFGQTPVQA